jgi:polyhydroxybutyrate depolymerase
MLAMASGVACGDDASGPTSTTTTGPSSSPSTPEAPVEPTCEESAAGDRRYLLCTAGDAADQPMIVVLHGRGSSNIEMQAATRLENAASEKGLAVVYPDAVDKGWGDDTFPSPSRPAGDEDLVALDDLIEEVRDDRRIDDGAPVAMVGFSNGASMALRYAAQRPDDVRVVVSVAGQLPRDPAIRPADRVPLLEIYGSADPIRPFATGIADPPERQPGGPTPTLPTPDTVAAFVARGDGAVEEQEPRETDPEPNDGTRLRTQRWIDERGMLAELVTVVDGGHTWPSAHAPFTGGERFGPTSRDLDASATAVDFILATDDSG